MKSIKNFMVVFISLVSLNTKAQWTGSNIATTTTSDVGIGIITPISKLEIQNNMRYSLSQQFINKAGLTIRNSQNFSSISPINKLPSLFVANWTMPNILEITNSKSFSSGSILFTNEPILIVDWYGKIGIGKEYPTSPLDVDGIVTSTGQQVNGNSNILGSMRIGPLAANNNYANYRLSVDGDIICKKTVVQTTNWADFVFDENYSLMPLDKVQDFISKNNHLPNMPSELEVVANGQNIGEIQKLQQAKIEELTLYIIQLEKRLNMVENK